MVSRQEHVEQGVAGGGDKRDEQMEGELRSLTRTICVDGKQLSRPFVVQIISFACLPVCIGR
jgi:hypothetical protein